MSRQKLLLLAVVLVAPYCFGQGSPNESQKKPKADPGYSIIVTPPSEPLRLGSAIVVGVRVTVGQKEIYWRAEKSDTGYRAFQFLLKKDGREVETTAFHRKITGRQRPSDPQEIEDGGSIVAPAGPGKSFIFPVDLTKLYNITEPGTYTLEVSRTDEDNETTVRAKPVIFAVGR